MKYYTMVKRLGNPKLTAEQMTYTLIGSDMSVNVITGTHLAKEIVDKKLIVTNMAISNKGLVSTNGALNKYTTIDENNMVVGTPRAVILSRIELNGQLKSYLIFTVRGTVEQVPATVAGKFAAEGLIANGKPRNSDQGVVVAAIGGTYPLYDAKVKEKVANPTLEILFFGAAVEKTGNCEYVGAIVGSKSATVASKLYHQLYTKNAEMIDGLNKVIPEDTKAMINGFKVRQVNGANFYGVFPLREITGLIKTSAEVKKSKNGVMVAVTDYNDDCAESILIVTNPGTKDQKVARAQKGNEKTEAGIKTYTEKVVDLLK